MPRACNAAFSTSLEPPFRQGGANLGNYKHSIYSATSSSEHQADFQARRLNARGLQIGGSRKTPANKARGLDIDKAFAHYLGAARHAAPSSASRLPCCQQQVRLRGTTAFTTNSSPPWHDCFVVNDTTALLSARRSSSSYGHLAIKFQSNRICNVRRDAAIIADGIDEFIVKLLAVVSGRPNLASLGGHRLVENNKAPRSGLIANVAHPPCR